VSYSVYIPQGQRDKPCNTIRVEDTDVLSLDTVLAAYIALEVLL
jgi:hypothetical protein